MTETSTIDIDGRTVAYIEEGEGPVALVLVTHRVPEADGLGIITHYLDEEAGFRIVRIGLRADAASQDEHVADIVAVLDRVGLADAWIGGHGASGTVARAFAAAHTERVNGLLLLGAENIEEPLASAIPVLIVQGTADDVTPIDNANAVHALAPERVSIKQLVGAGHDFPVTHPIDAAVIIEEYLDWD